MSATTYVAKGLQPCACGHSDDSRVAKGIHFGYPSCCIEYYLERSVRYDLGLDVDEGPWKLDGSGFIPCPDHDQSTEAELVELIRAGRKCPIPFTPNPPAEFAEVLPPCDCYPHTASQPCTCNGCRYCTGHKHGCTCDINWACTEHGPCPERARNQRISDLAGQIHDHYEGGDL